jgi:hypothetical protein
VLASPEQVDSKIHGDISMWVVTSIEVTASNGSLRAISPKRISSATISVRAKNGAWQANSIWKLGAINAPAALREDVKIRPISGQIEEKPDGGEYDWSTLLNLAVKTSPLQAVLCIGKNVPEMPL